MTRSSLAVILTLCGATAVTVSGPARAHEVLSLRVPVPGAALPPGATTSTAIFRAEALRSDAVTLAASRLALTRSKDPQVLNHARRAISNRQATTDALAPPAGLETSAAQGAADALDARTPHARREPAEVLRPADRAVIDQLGAARDETSFNRAYAEQQSRWDERTLALYNGFYQHGDTEQARRFAYEALPWIESERARSVALNELYNG